MKSIPWVLAVSSAAVAFASCSSPSDSGAAASATASGGATTTGEPSSSSVSGSGAGGSGTGGGACQTSDPLWARNGGSAAKLDEQAFGVAQDAQGNVYVTGGVAGDATFGNIQVKGNSATNLDIFVAKLDPMGTWQWVDVFGGDGPDIGTDIGVDDAGDVYVAANFESSQMVDFGGTPLKSSPLSGSAVVMKLDGNGKVLWAEATSGPSGETVKSLHVDAPGNVWLSGHYSGGFNLGAASIPGAGLVNGWIAKLDAAGNPLWIQAAGGGASDRSFFEGVGAYGAVTVVIGRVEGSATIDTKMVTGNGALVASIDDMGHPIWVKLIPTSPNAMLSLNDVAVDQTGHAFILGDLSGSVSIDGTMVKSTGNSDAFLAQLDMAGNLGWHAQGSGGFVQAFSIAWDGEQSLYVTGFHSAPATFDGAMITHATGAMVVKYDVGGAVRWAVGDGEFAGGYSVSARSKVLGVAYAGVLAGMSQFGSTVLMPAGKSDPFVAQLCR